MIIVDIFSDLNNFYKINEIINEIYDDGKIIEDSRKYMFIAIRVINGINKFTYKLLINFSRSRNMREI